MHVRRMLEEIYDSVNIDWSDSKLDRLYEATDGHPGHADDATEAQQQELWELCQGIAETMPA